MIENAIVQNNLWDFRKKLLEVCFPRPRYCFVGVLGIKPFVVNIDMITKI